MSTAQRTNTPLNLETMSEAQFRQRIKDLRERYPAMTDPVKKDQFDSWEDVVDLFQNHDGGIIESSRSARLGQMRKHANRGIAARKPATRQTGPRRANAAPSMSSLVKPGLYEGLPWRQIVPRFKGEEIDYTKARFRRQRVGVGKCTGEKLRQVTSSFAFGYILCESARRSLRHIQENPNDARILWHASARFEEASLAYWFGSDYANAQMSRMLHKIEEILTEWSLAFCGGFRNVLPVFIRCKSTNGVGGEGVMARHLVKNTIELMPRHFNRHQALQNITVLHEMGHRCKSLLKPRDERHELCNGGWNGPENMCYRDSNQIKNYDSLFSDGNPRILATAATGGNTSARKVMLNNIDNYVSYMWNRYLDHGERVLEVMPPQTKPSKPRPPSANASKPPNR